MREFQSRQDSWGRGLAQLAAPANQGWSAVEEQQPRQWHWASHCWCGLAEDRNGTLEFSICSGHWMTGRTSPRILLTFSFSGSISFAISSFLISAIVLGPFLSLWALKPWPDNKSSKSADTFGLESWKWRRFEIIITAWMHLTLAFYIRYILWLVNHINDLPVLMNVQVLMKDVV